MATHSREEFEQALEALGRILERQGLRYELVCIGGASLLMIGIGLRPTRDLDVLSFYEHGNLAAIGELPPPLAQAVEDVGGAFGLESDWLNLGPKALMDFGLPAGFSDRLHKQDYGGVVLYLAHRDDQVFLKFYAACDEGSDGKHIQDLRLLGPNTDELIAAARWAFTHDPSLGFRGEALSLLEHLGVEVGNDDL